MRADLHKKGNIFTIETRETEAQFATYHQTPYDSNNNNEQYAISIDDHSFYDKSQLPKAKKREKFSIKDLLFCWGKKDIAADSKVCVGIIKSTFSFEIQDNTLTFPTE